VGFLFGELMVSCRVLRINLFEDGNEKEWADQSAGVGSRGSCWLGGGIVFYPQYGRELDDG